MQDSLLGFFPLPSLASQLHLTMVVQEYRGGRRLTEGGTSYGRFIDVIIHDEVGLCSDAVCFGSLILLYVTPHYAPVCEPHKVIDST